MTLRRLRWRLVDGPDSWAAQRRAERARRLVQEFPDLASMTVLDLGGRVEAWRRSPVRPRRVHVVNVESEPDHVPEWASVEEGDACDLPAAVTRRRYDLVF
ncbi:MAG: class I SAM-dependent methyltransferase, partial [Actinomycetes bacterium]